MTRVVTTGSLLLCSLLLTALGCAATRMKVPTPLASQPGWSIAGYTEDSFREPDITLEGHRVHKLVRMRRPLKSTSPNATLTGARGYRFELALGDSVLQAECTEKVDPRELWLLRFGQGAMHLDCSCQAGAQKRVVLALVDDKGSLELGEGSRFAIAPVLESAAGKQQSKPLGYTLQSSLGDRREGALERTGHGRAWPPAGLSASETTDLACAYAALLLYRPEP